MRRKIPSTGALIAFEAAARYQSFSRAAEELTLTEGAISRQIAVLEDYLGVQLFHRVKKRVTLSDIGTAYFIKVKEDLTRLERNTLGAMAYQNGQKFLELAVIPTFTSKWLIPKIAEFSRLHPGITINLSERALPFLFGTPISLRPSITAIRHGPDARRKNCLTRSWCRSAARPCWVGARSAPSWIC